MLALSLVRRIESEVYDQSCLGMSDRDWTLASRVAEVYNRSQCCILSKESSGEKCGALNTTHTKGQITIKVECCKDLVVSREAF